jgi:hypothetical protein
MPFSTEAIAWATPTMIHSQHSSDVRRSFGHCRKAVINSKQARKV